MTEKTNKIKLPKYSSYLTSEDSILLESFCYQFNCSKAKALPLLLKLWNDNKGKVSNELATISNSDIPEKKYDERLATIEDKLAKVSYDEDLAMIKERLATIEDKLAKVSYDEDLAMIKERLATIEDKLAKVSYDELTNEQKENNTESIALRECPILPFENDLGVNVPLTDNQKYVKEEISLEELETKLGQQPQKISEDVVCEILKVSKEYLTPSRSTKLQSNKKIVFDKLQLISKRPKIYSNPYSNISQTT